MRRTLRHLLPEKIAKRKSKGNPSEAFFRAVRREFSWLSRLFEEPLVCSYGFIDAAKFRAELHKVRRGCEVNTTLFLKVIPLEIWLRTLESRLRVVNVIAGERSEAHLAAV